jgi:4-diphosphocytidyl-2-C-methyl-D-erythritol kinase
LLTVFQSIDYHDLISVEIGGDSVEIQVSGENVPSDETNLAIRAARAYLERWAPGIGVRLGLEKRIPVGGGLGGGSSNAATVLLALQDLLGSPAAALDLVEVAASLGADVPYFLVGGTALGRGRGDEITPLPDLAEQSLDLVIPNCRISTAEVFAAIDELTVHPSRSSISALVGGEYSGSLSGLNGWNDLQPIVLSKYSEVASAFSAMNELDCAVQLSGSGATLFVIPRSQVKVETAVLARSLPSDCRVVTTKTLSRKSLQNFRTVH